ncbi:MAG: hypothetical protein ACETWE_09630 [Candidatus Bathyarchaeia archaeon]
MSIDVRIRRLAGSSGFETLILTLTLLTCLGENGTPCEAETVYVYYGYVPPTIRSVYEESDDGMVFATPNTWRPPRLDIIGVNDSTTVSIYDLGRKAPLVSFKVDRMQLHSWELANETYFKVVSDKPIAALLSGGGRVCAWGATQVRAMHATFYPSTDGGFCGREFMYIAAPTFLESPQMNAYNIFAVEDAHVTIYDIEGEVTKLEASANSFIKVSLKEGRVYRVVSTGRILVSGLDMECFSYLPSVTGGFVGRHFVGSLLSIGRESFMVVAMQDCEVHIWDLKRPAWHMGLFGPDLKKSLRAGEYWFDSSIAGQTPLRIDSTGDTSVLMGAGGANWGDPPLGNLSVPENLGDDVSFIGMKPGETLGFFAPTQAVIFSAADGFVTIDGIPVDMEEDEYRIVLHGIHTITGNIPILVEVLGSANTWASWDPHIRYGYDNWCSYLVSVQSLEVAYPPAPSIGGFIEVVPFLAIGISVCIIVAAAFLFMKRRRRRLAKTHNP